MAEQQCPQCKSNSYLNPNLIIYYSPCFHKLCETCVLRYFGSGQAPCPECGTLLRKINYMEQTFEDLGVEKECLLRKRLKLVWYMSDKLNSESVFNDYLEKFDDLVFELLVCSKDECDCRIKKLETRYGVQSKVEMEADEEEHVVVDDSKIKEVKDKEIKRVKVVSVFDPLIDMDVVDVKLDRQGNVLPKEFRVNLLEAGFSEKILEFRFLLSLFDNEF